MSALKGVIWRTRAQEMAHSTDLKNKQPQYSKAGGLLRGSVGLSEDDTTDKVSERTSYFLTILESGSPRSAKHWQD